MTLEEYDEIVTRPLEEQRYLFHKRKTEGLVTKSITDTYYYVDEWKLFWKKRLLRYPYKSTGFCLKGAKVYFRNCNSRSVIYQLDAEAKRRFNLDWIPDYLKRTITTGAFSKILRKQITNPNQLLTYYRKYGIRNKELSINAIDKVLRLGLDLNSLIETCNFNSIEALEVKSNNYGWVGLINDISRECFILGKRFNILWSDKRLREFHQQNIKEINQLDLKFLRKEIYKLPEITLPENFELIDNSHRLYEEGKNMQHCVYSYHNRIKRENYLALHYNGGEDATIGIRVNNSKFEIEQIKTRRNGKPQDEELIRNIVNSEIIPQLPEPVSKSTSAYTNNYNNRYENVNYQPLPF